MTVTCGIAGVFDYSARALRRGLPQRGKMPRSVNRGNGAVQTALPQWKGDVHQVKGLKKVLVEPTAWRAFTAV